MRVQVIANRLSEPNPETGAIVTAAKNDILTVSDAFGQHLCDRGWAKDSAGKYIGAAFTPGVAKVAPDKLTVKKGGTR